jgi:hypothetical protein
MGSDASIFRVEEQAELRKKKQRTDNFGETIQI